MAADEFPFATSVCCCCGALCTLVTLMSAELAAGRAAAVLLATAEAVAAVIVVARLKDTVVVVVPVPAPAPAGVPVAVVDGASVLRSAPTGSSLSASAKSETPPAAGFDDEAADGCSLNADAMEFASELALASRSGRAILAAKEAAGVGSLLLGFGDCTSGIGFDEAPEVEALEGSAKCLMGTLVGTETPIACETFAELPAAAAAAAAAVALPLTGTCPLSCSFTTIDIARECVMDLCTSTRSTCVRAAECL